MRGWPMRGWFGSAAFVLLAPACAHAQTLSEAIDAAYRQNPTLAAARLGARAADESINQARANYLPRIDALASIGTSRTESRNAGAPRTRVDTDPESYGVEAVQPLYTGGLRRAQSAAARAQSQGARAALRSVEQGVLLAVVAAYEDVRRDEEVVRIRQNDVDVLARQLESSEIRFEVGEITRTDVAQSEARLAGGRAGLASALAALEASRANFAALIGAPPENLQVPPPHPPLPADLESAVASAVAAHPDLAFAEENERAARAQIGVERSALLPQVALVGRWDNAFDSQGPGIEIEGSSAVAQITIPLFEGGFASSRVRQSRFNADRAEAETEAARRAIVAEVVAAWNDVAAARRVAESAREQARANAFALDGVEQEQLVGLRTTLEVLNAQQEALDAQLAVVQAERDSYVAAHALLAAVGALDGAVLAVEGPLYDPDGPRSQLRGALQWQDGAESP